MTTDSVSDSPPPRPRMSWVKRLLIATALLFLAGVTALGGWWYVSQNELNSRLAALKAQGLPTTAAEINTYYAVPKGVTDSTALWTKAITGVHALGLAARAKSLPYVGAEGPPTAPLPGQTWDQLPA